MRLKFDFQSSANISFGIFDLDIPIGAHTWYRQVLSIISLSLEVLMVRCAFNISIIILNVSFKSSVRRFICYSYVEYKACIMLQLSIECFYYTAWLYKVFFFISSRVSLIKLCFSSVLKINHCCSSRLFCFSASNFLLPKAFRLDHIFYLMTIIKWREVLYVISSKVFMVMFCDLRYLKARRGIVVKTRLTLLRTLLLLGSGFNWEPWGSTLGILSKETAIAFCSKIRWALTRQTKFSQN